ncbi:MAG TPA: hypothetical protein P5262_04210 [Candidatus Moranbacteria bacterium]|nr:hypothetical protein [Candidatus Moranbacteria bacterium]
MRAWLAAQWAMFQASFPNASAWILRNLRAILALVGGIIFFSLAIHSCTSSSSGTPAPGAGWFFMKLAFVGLIAAAVISRDRPYLAWTLAGLAGLFFLVILGKMDSLFGWTTLGLPLLAAAGVWGWNRTDGRTRSFLGFASGVVISFWLYLFLQNNMSFKLDFLGDRITNSELLIIGFLAIGLFAFATWKRSKVFYLISFLILASWLGNEVFKEIADRYPSMLKLSVPSGITELGNATNERLKIIADEVKNPKKIKKEEKKETYSLTLYGIVSEEVSLSPGTWKVSRDWKLAEYRLREWADYRPITEEIKISKKSDVFFRNKDKSGKSNVYSQIIVSN